MNLYEVTFITRQDISSNEVDKIADKLTAIATEMSGKLIKKEYWGLRNLAYPIKKSRKGHYTMLGLEASAEAIEEILRVMSISEDILRQLIVKVEAISSEPSPVMNMKKNSTISSSDNDSTNNEEQ
jgi:small subunit ribosomal protein S6